MYLPNLNICVRCVAAFDEWMAGEGCALDYWRGLCAHAPGIFEYFIPISALRCGVSVNAHVMQFNGRHNLMAATAARLSRPDAERILAIAMSVIIM